MKLDGRQCKAEELLRVYWGVGIVDPSEPDYVKGMGVPLDEHVRCKFVANRGSDYCDKHKFLRSLASRALDAQQDGAK